MVPENVVSQLTSRTAFRENIALPGTARAALAGQNEGGLPGALQNSSEPPMRQDGVEGDGRREPTELFKPSRLRLDSRVVLAHTTFQWLPTSLWILLIWGKLEGRLRASWWGVFAPTITGHLLLLLLHLTTMALAVRLVRKQIGPPPPPSASAGTLLTYACLRRRREAAQRMEAANDAIECTSVLLTKMMFCGALQRAALGVTPLRLIFTPIWVGWAVTSALHCLKPGVEVVTWSGPLRRSLAAVFLLLLALKVDHAGVSSWAVVFLVPFWGCVVLVTMACTVGGLILTHLCDGPRLHPRLSSRPRSRLPLLLLEGAAVGVLLSFALPHLIAVRALQRRLEDRDSDGDRGGAGGSVGLQDIMGPMSLSWLAMWLFSLVGVVGLALREARNERLAAAGAVWSAYEGVAGTMTMRLGWEEEQRRRVDKLSEEELTRLVEAVMAGKTKPSRLRRVGDQLYRRLETEAETEAEGGQQGQGGRPEAGAQGHVCAAIGTGGAARGTGSVPAAEPAAGGAGVAAAGGGGAAGCRGPDVAPRVAGPPAAPTSASSSPSVAVSTSSPSRAAPSSIEVVPTGGGAAAAAGTGARSTASAADTAGGGGGGAAAPDPQPEETSLPAWRYVSSGRGGSGRIVGGCGGGSSGRAPRQWGQSAAAFLDIQPLEERGEGEAAEGHQPGGSRGGCSSGDVARSAAGAGGGDGDTGGGGGGGGGRSSHGRWRPGADPGHNGRCPCPCPCPCCLVSGPGPSGGACACAYDGLPLLYGSAEAAEGEAGGGVSGGGAAAASPAVPVSVPPLVAAPAELPASAAAAAVAAEASAASAAAGAGGSTAAGESAGLVGGGITTVPRAAVGAKEAAGSVVSAGGRCGSADGRGPGPSVQLPRCTAEINPSSRWSDTAESRRRSGGGGGGGGADAVAVPAGRRTPSGYLGAALRPDLVPPPGTVRGNSASAGQQSQPSASHSQQQQQQPQSCVICFDGEASCVFLECGHGGFCRRCAYLLFVRPPHECPSCRGSIAQVLQLETDGVEVGEVARVK
ncbi:hypothetical protein PLESTB_001577700 [Pleodorina starrii]|uniref:RING-type domain-containing protein n=1 Tax=Pleodorina starrii TaxID=330485 RepID=A0A9W6F911_9CHLO|nr:hypothetical protein PLESTM_000727500 [Pleodorina starrii]GLC60136.1 hypothetical protein PLESTB_001577700 [Pleodorina starrii]GLC70051.1 hypothetical protein PLESTF_000917500 [Pleodorina starrii]